MQNLERYLEENRRELKMSPEVREVSDSFRNYWELLYGIKSNSGTDKDPMYLHRSRFASEVLREFNGFQPQIQQFLPDIQVLHQDSQLEFKETDETEFGAKAVNRVFSGSYWLPKTNEVVEVNFEEGDHLKNLDPDSPQFVGVEHMRLRGQNLRGVNIVNLDKIEFTPPVIAEGIEELLDELVDKYPDNPSVKTAQSLLERIEELRERAKEDIEDESAEFGFQIEKRLIELSNKIGENFGWRKLPDFIRIGAPLNESERFGQGLYFLPKEDNFVYAQEEHGYIIRSRMDKLLGRKRKFASVPDLSTAEEAPVEYFYLCEDYGLVFGTIPTFHMTNGHKLLELLTQKHRAQIVQTVRDDIGKSINLVDHREQRRLARWMFGR